MELNMFGIQARNEGIYQDFFERRLYIAMHKYFYFSNQKRC